jgi:chromosomal replication initiator protein
LQHLDGRGFFNVESKELNESGVIWDKASLLLKQALPEDIFERWIGVIQPGERSKDTLYLRVANDFYSTWLEENYVPMIADAVASVTGERLIIRLVVDQDVRPAPESEISRRARIAKARSAAPTAERADNSSDHGQSHSAQRPSHGGSEHFTLNPRYVFETFVVGSSNEFAHAAAMAVAKAPAKAYNPLFLYGGVGLGKTHLMQAIGNFAVTKNPACKVCYLSSESFINEYIDALQNSQLPRFRKRFRSADILLIDDIQFLAGKERMQEEFFHTFNALFDGHKQIVLTCDRPAPEIPGLERRLVSRFEWGLVTEIDAPEFETRMAILRKKAQLMNVQVSDSVIHFSSVPPPLPP